MAGMTRDRLWLYATYSKRRHGSHGKTEPEPHDHDSRRPQEAEEGPTGLELDAASSQQPAPGTRASRWKDRAHLAPLVIRAAPEPGQPDGARNEAGQPRSREPDGNTDVLFESVTRDDGHHGGE